MNIYLSLIWGISVHTVRELILCGELRGKRTNKCIRKAWRTHPLRERISKPPAKRCLVFLAQDDQVWANNKQHVATRRKRVARRAQHIAPNVAMCCVHMLLSFGRGLTRRELTREPPWSTKYTEYTGKLWRTHTVRERTSNTHGTKKCTGKVWKTFLFQHAFYIAMFFSPVSVLF